MIDWNFILNPDTDNLTIDEPIGWDKIIFEIVRDRRFHGISIAYSANDIKLIGAGAVLLKAAYEQLSGGGVDADVQIKIEAICDGEVQDSETFKLDFGRYEEGCGDECTVSIGIQQISCFTDFNNNLDKKVDMKSDVAFDKLTALENYAGIAKTLTIPGKVIVLTDEAQTDPAITENLKDQFSWSALQSDGAIWPAFQNVKNAGLGSFVTSTFPEWNSIGGSTFPPYDTMPAMVNTTELLGEIKCALSDEEFTFRLKGSVTIVTGDDIDLTVKLFRLPAGLDEGTPGNWVEEYSQTLLNIVSPGGTFPYDLSGTIPLAITQGDLLYFYIYVDFTVTAFTVAQFEITQSIESFVKLEAMSLCEDSEANVFMLYEAVSRVCESITNKCMKIESDYYGRLDSEPNNYIADGCGALRCITSGLYLRKAETPQFFTSMKDLLDGLLCIDNIGYALINPGGVETMKIEPAEYFYQDFEMMSATDANKVTKKVVTAEIPGVIKCGYEKWEAEKIGGLDEFNSPREHRLTIKNANAPVDIRCKFVAGGYPIEWTRQQSFAATGAADTKFDNDTFILCLYRIYGYPYPGAGVYVEQGGITSPGNMTHPDTVINFRISPVRNLMRWVKSFFGSYRDYADADSKLILSSGEGNILAEGYLSDLCSPEDTIMSENEDIDSTKFKDVTDAVPLIRPESVIFDYPMSLSDFKIIRANPYGYILHDCGPDKKGHIDKIRYRPSAGVASFELRNRY